MEEKKVKMTAFYISLLNTQTTKEWSFSSTEEAKDYIEQNINELSAPIYDLSTDKVEEEGFEYDVTNFVKFNFSHITVTDYTEPKDIINK